MKGSEIVSVEFMDSRFSGRFWIFRIGLEGGSDHHVQDHGEAHESSANSEALDAAEKIGGDLARDDANRDAADQDHHTRAPGADGCQLSDIRRRAFFCHEEIPKSSGSRWKIASCRQWGNIPLLQMSED